MPKVVYIEHSGTQHEIDVTDGWTLMQGATLSGIDGIEGECGGCCSCATCHVYVDEAFLDKLEPANEIEDEMLECTVCERRQNSRLSCQITASPELDGIIVRLPEAQS